MGLETKLTCDGCGGDIKFTGNCEDWRIRLSNERVPSRGGMVTAMAIRPCLDRDYYFCGTKCLKQVVAKL